MKICKYVCFILLSAANIAVIVKCWGFLQLSYVPRLLIALSICCGFLILTDVKSKSLLITILIILSSAMLVGCIYAIYWRRPLGFWVVISVTAVMAKYFLSEPKSRKDGIVMKMIAVTVSVTIFILTIFLGTFTVASDKQALINGPKTMWDSDSQAVFDEICIESSTDKEVVIAAYNWIMNNISYNHDYYPNYQYFNVKRTLSLRSGICYDFANLFAAICRSQGVPCYCVDGYHKENKHYLHAWNRVFFNGVWWNLDVTYDTARHNKSSDLKLYGFHACENQYSPDDEYIIMKMY